MKFIQYINESFEKKIFDLLDDFLRDSNTSIDDIVSGNDDTLNALINHLAGVLNISGIALYNSCISNGITGGTNINKRTGTISIHIDLPQEVSKKERSTKKFKLSILGVLFHEINHVMAWRSPHRTYNLNYISGRGDSESFTRYFLQDTERYSKAISVAVISLINNIDIFSEISNIREISRKLKDLDDVNKELTHFVNKYNIPDINDIAVVSFYIYNLHILSNDKSLNRKLRNQFESYLKNLEKSYKGFKFYFEKYGII